MKLLRQKKLTSILLFLMILVGVMYPLFTPYNADDFNFDMLLKPSITHLLGTDELGHDILSMLLVGFRYTIGISLLSATISTIVGTVMGITAACFPGKVDRILMRLTELFIIVPEIVILMFFASFANPGIQNTVIAIAFFSWSKVARVVRANAAIAMTKDDIRYTVLMRGRLHDIMRKLWREIYPVISTMFVLQCSKAAVYEATLSFFGIGDPLVKTWGRMIKTALNYEGLFDDGAYLNYLLPPIFCICLFSVLLSYLSYRDWGENI